MLQKNRYGHNFQLNALKSINLKIFAASVFSATPTLGRQFSSTTRRDPTGVVLPVTMPQAYVVVGGMKRVEKLNAVTTLLPEGDSPWSNVPDYTCRSSPDYRLFSII